MDATINKFLELLPAGSHGLIILVMGLALAASVYVNVVLYRGGLAKDVIINESKRIGDRALVMLINAREKNGSD
jgi:hypothetical protein